MDAFTRMTLHKTLLEDDFSKRATILKVLNLFPKEITFNKANTKEEVSCSYVTRKDFTDSKLLDLIVGKCPVPTLHTRVNGSKVDHSPLSYIGSELRAENIEEWRVRCKEIGKHHINMAYALTILPKEFSISVSTKNSLLAMFWVGVSQITDVDLLHKLLYDHRRAGKPNNTITHLVCDKNQVYQGRLL